MEVKTKQACSPTRRGSGLVFAVVLLFVILGMVVTLSSITVLETKMSQKTKSSVGAFYNSESGVEWALNKIATGTGENISDIFGAGFSGGKVDCPSGFGCEIYLLDENNQVIASDTAIDQVKAIRSVGTGTAGDITQRAIEAAVGASGNACYVSYKNDATDAACITGFKNKGSVGNWGNCMWSNYAMFRPPSAPCSSWTSADFGTAYLCCLQ